MIDKNGELFSGINCVKRLGAMNAHWVSSPHNSLLLDVTTVWSIFLRYVRKDNVEREYVIINICLSWFIFLRCLLYARNPSYFFLFPSPYHSISFPLVSGCIYLNLFHDFGTPSTCHVIKSSELCGIGKHWYFMWWPKLTPNTLSVNIHKIKEVFLHTSSTQLSQRFDTFVINTVNVYKKWRPLWTLFYLPLIIRYKFKLKKSICVLCGLLSIR